MENCIRAKNLVVTLESSVCCASYRLQVVARGHASKKKMLKYGHKNGPLRFLNSRLTKSLAWMSIHARYQKNFFWNHMLFNFVTMSFSLLPRAPTHCTAFQLSCFPHTWMESVLAILNLFQAKPRVVPQSRVTDKIGLLWHNNSHSLRAVVDCQVPWLMDPLDKQV